jgi:alkylated DNA repair protein alkB homolog 8
LGKWRSALGAAMEGGEGEERGGEGRGRQRSMGTCLTAPTGFSYMRKAPAGRSRHVHLLWVVARPVLSDGTRGKALTKVEAASVIDEEIRAIANGRVASALYQPSTKRGEGFVSLEGVEEAVSVVSALGPGESGAKSRLLARGVEVTMATFTIGGDPGVDVSVFLAAPMEAQASPPRGLVPGGEKGGDDERGGFPAGLYLIPEFLSEEEERDLMGRVDEAGTGEDGVDVGWVTTLSRRVRHWGARFDYISRRVVSLDARTPDARAPLPLPAWLGDLERRVRTAADEALPRAASDPTPMLDQVTANEYLAGQGIRAHIDTRSAFGPVIASLSLLAPTVMEFRIPDTRPGRDGAGEGEAGGGGEGDGTAEHPNASNVVLNVPARSLLLLTGPARYEWAHAITPRLWDNIEGRARPRSRRVSITFRSLCLPDAFLPPPATDPDAPPSEFHSHRLALATGAFSSSSSSSSSSTSSTSSSSSSSGVSVRRGPPAPAVERQFVHAFYEEAARHFAQTRHTPWPRVTAFTSALAAGSLVADVGCGNGRLMERGQGLEWVGVDASAGLCAEAQKKGREVAVGDATRVPLRSGAFDAALSIAVLHHLSTQERRRAAVAEIARILRPGGSAIVQAWAFEQPEDSRRTFLTHDVMVPWRLSEGKTTRKQKAGEEGARDDRGADGVDLAASTSSAVSTSTSFATTSASSLPSAAAPTLTLQRFCHLYVRGELDEDVRVAAPDLHIVESWYDRGNWCVIVRKSPL